MMQYILASGPAPWENVLEVVGQIAAFILVLELLLFVVIAVALNAGLAIGFAWVQEKAELVKKLRPAVDSVNATAEAAIQEKLPADGAGKTIKLPAETAKSINSVMHTVKQIPAQANTVEEKIEQGSDRVTQAVIEFRARTVMVQTVVKAFFLPGLTTRRLPAPKSAEEKLLADKRIPALEAPADSKMEIAPPSAATDGRLLEPVAASSRSARTTGT